MRSSAKLSAGVNNMGMVLMAKKEMAAPMIERHSEVVA